jgi:hypothetical protein
MLSASLNKALTLMMEDVRTSETSASFYETARRKIPENCYLHSQAVPWLSRRPLTAEAGVRARFCPCGSRDRVALTQVFLQVLWFPLSVSFHHDSPYSYIIWGMNNRPVGGRRSETQSLPIDINGNSIQPCPSCSLRFP